MSVSTTLQRFEFEQPQMGVPFRLVFYGLDRIEAENAAKKAFARVAELNQIMSDYETDSELNQLSFGSGSGQAVELSQDLWGVLALSQQIARESEGAFDVTIGPCAALWRKARREKELPEPWRIEHFLERVGYTNLVLKADSRSAVLLKENMRLDLGGIAKGYAADEALEVLRRTGFPRALVAASGDLAIGDPPPGKEGWSVEVIGSDIEEGAEPFMTIVRNAGVATSGDLTQHLEIEGVRYSHIVNPFTCVGMTNQSLTTVIAPSARIADPLATTLGILDPSEGVELADKYDAAFRTVRLENGRLRVFANRRFKRIQNERETAGTFVSGVD